MKKKNIKKSGFVLNNNFKSFKINGWKDKFTSFKKRINLKRVQTFIEKKPFVSLFIVLGALLFFMVLGNAFFSPKPLALNTNTPVKKVSTFKLGVASLASYQGKVEKTGVVKIVAQMPGIVSTINVTEGQQVNAGTSLLSLSSNYNGGNAASIQRQIAQTQYNNAQNSYSEQGDIIGKQKDLANKSHDNQVLMQQITTNSITQTQGLSDLNNSIINSLSAAIQSLPAGSKDLLTLQGQLSQFSSAQNQTNSALQNLQVQGNQASVDSAKEQHDVAVEQLDLQRKMLDMNLDLSRLQYNLALISEANMFPSTPISGTVDRIYIKPGDNITPGTPLVNISGSSQHIKVVVNLSQDVAKNISTIEPSVLLINGKEIRMMPSYVSMDATNGNLYSAIYDLDDSLSSSLSDSSYITVNIPVGTPDSINENPFIPLDSVIQTQEEAFVFILGNKNEAIVKKVKLGDIQGKFVQVLSGLPRDAQIILNRNVIDGDKVQVVK